MNTSVHAESSETFTTRKESLYRLYLNQISTESLCRGDSADTVNKKVTEWSVTFCARQELLLTDLYWIPAFAGMSIKKKVKRKQYSLSKNLQIFTSMLLGSLSSLQYSITKSRFYNIFYLCFTNFFRNSFFTLWFPGILFCIMRLFEPLWAIVKYEYIINGEG